MNLYFKKNNGVTALESSLTFPVIFCLIFFMIELFKITDTQSSLDSIGTDMSFDFMGSKNTKNFEAIINKYKPKYIQYNDITWYFSIYPNIIDMVQNESYGGGEVFWPDNNQSTSSGSSEYIEADNVSGFSSHSGNIQLSNCKQPEYDFKIENVNTTMKSLSEKAFVLTIVCDYKFSSSFVGKCFGGGSNTIGGSKFLIWSKNVGICR